MVQLVSKEEIEKAKEYRSMEQPVFKRYDKEKGFKKGGGGGGGNGKGFKPRPAPKSALDGFIQRDIVIKMRDGKFESGKLESIFQYEIIITGNDGLPVIIYKHAIDSIKLKVS